MVTTLQMQAIRTIVLVIARHQLAVLKGITATVELHNNHQHQRLSNRQIPHLVLHGMEHLMVKAESSMVKIMIMVQEPITNGKVEIGITIKNLNKKDDIKN